MGISGLLPLLKPITIKTHLRDFSGKTLVIDGHSWIHKGVYGSGLAIFEGKDINSHVNYCIKKLAMFFDAGVTPLFVFDGGTLPIKASQEAERETYFNNLLCSRRREEAKKIVIRALKSNDRKMAWEYANRCVDVTPLMVAKLALELQARKIKYIVAPYEADAQMAFLVKNGFADAVVSEDSDMLLFGCSKVLFKLGADGYGDLIKLEDISKTSSFKAFTQLQFRHTCILSGCDYLPSLPKLGMGTAIRLMQIHKGSIDAVMKALKSPTSNYETKQIEDYEKAFILADLTFNHQRIWDPLKKQIVTLQPIDLQAISCLPQDIINVLLNDNELVQLVDEWPYPIHKLEFLGPPIDNIELAEGIVMGSICPITKSPLYVLPNIIQKKEDIQVVKTPWLTRLSLKPDIYNKENIPEPSNVIVCRKDEQQIFSDKEPLLSKMTFAGKRKKISPYFDKKIAKF